MAPNLNEPPTIQLIQGTRGPINLIFANQFKRTNPSKTKGFYLKVANLGPHVTFL